jgi:hypothetical protein
MRHERYHMPIPPNWLLDPMMLRMAVALLSAMARYP